MIEYEDFSLKIEPKRGEVYPVIVLHSPAGEGRSSFTLPFNPDEIGDILFDLGWTVRGDRQMPMRDVSPAATRTRPQQIGDQLFNALFSGTVRSLLDHSLGMIHGRQRGLRIKLHIDPEDPSLAQLASLPWEFLYRKEKREFLNLSRFTPIIRYLDVQSPYTPLSLEPPLRILVVISDPADYERLDLDRERELIETSWAKHEGVQVEFMEEATVLALQDRLTNKPYHVLHYMGHGGFDKRSGRGVLVMEDEDGQGAIVDGNTLGILLRDIPTMRLAFLNACETARVTKEKGLDPFAGVAAAMVMAGIPAVVAMQFPVSDRAAITFSQKFYPLLARGEPVDAAVAEGRRAICLANSGTMEWGTPVLFLRAPQGVIFQVSETQRKKVPLPEIPELPEELDVELEQRLTELYTLGLSAFWLEEWDKAARNFQAIVDVRPDYEDVADKLAEAKQQAILYALYIKAQKAQEDEEWSAALKTLEQISAEAGDYKDAKERLQTVRKQKQLADLYAEAQHLHQAQQWQAVVKVFSQIHAIEPDYPDPEGLLPAAEREVSKLRRQAKLNDLYSQAVREMNAGHWQEARQLLVEVQGIEPDFRDTERLLARVEQETERQEKEQRRQEQIAIYYEQALGLAQAQQWRQVLAKMDEIQSLDPEFYDPEELAAEAREELKKEDVEARRQSELATLYAEAVRLLEAEQYQQVLEKWGEVQARDPRYPDRQNVQVNARKKLESLAKGNPPRRRLPRWAVATIIGGLVLAGIICIFTGQIASLIGGYASPTATEAPPAEQPPAEEPPAEEPPAEDMEPVTLHVLTWHYPPMVEFVEAFNEKFEAAHPNITVDYSVVNANDIQTVTQTRLTANDIDVIAMFGFANAAQPYMSEVEPQAWQQLVQAGLLMDLTGQPFVDNYDEASIRDAGTVDGKVYQVNLGRVSYSGMYYNKDLFAEYGVEVPTTWDELVAACETFKENGVECMTNGGADGWPIFVGAYGLLGALYPDQAAMVEGLWTGELKWDDPETLELWEKYKVYAQDMLEPGTSGIAGDAAPGRFASGAVAMFPNGFWYAGAIEAAEPDFEWGYIPFPGSDNAEDNQYLFGKYDLGWAIAANTPNEEAALLYLSEFSEPDNYQEFVNAVGFLPTQPGATLETQVGQEVAPYLENFLVGFEQFWSTPKGAGQWANGSQGAAYFQPFGEWDDAVAFAQQAQADLQAGLDTLE